MFSSLTNVTGLSPNHSGKRKYALTRLTPHCVVGQATAERIIEIFKPTSRQASCNYGIGKDGRIAGVVDEDNRSWCSSSSDNDNRAITFEIASDNEHPYAMTDAAIDSFVKLAADICRRNNKTRVVWISEKDKALAYKVKDNELLITVHRWFANKSCPGDWMFERMGDIAARINTAIDLNNAGVTEPPVAPNPDGTPFLWKTDGAPIYDNVPVISAPKGTYTIVGVFGEYGKLKSGAGYVKLSDGKKV